MIVTLFVLICESLAAALVYTFLGHGEARYGRYPSKSLSSHRAICEQLELPEYVRHKYKYVRYGIFRNRRPQEELLILTTSRRRVKSRKTAYSRTRKPVFCGRCEEMSNVCLHSFRQTAVILAKPCASQAATCFGRRWLTPLRSNTDIAVTRPKCAPTSAFSSPFSRAISVRFQPRAFSTFPSLNAKGRKPTKSATKPLPPFHRLDIREAFGQPTDESIGNDVLQTLQRRRVSGSLVEHGIHIKGCTIPQQSLKKALKWLRQRYPIDEELSAERWAFDSVNNLEYKFEKRAQELGVEGVGGPGDIYSSPGNRSVHDEARVYQAEKAKQEEERREKSGEAQQQRELQLARVQDREQRTYTDTRGNLEVLLKSNRCRSSC